MEGYDTMASKKTKKKNPTNPKDYLIKIGIIIFLILALIYCYMWYRVKEQEKYQTSYLISSNTISYEMTEINEIDAVLSETPNNYFVYISYTKDQKVYNLEKDLKPIINKYDLHNNFYYLNVTDIKDKNTAYLKDIASKLNIPNSKLTKVPVILYFSDGKLIANNIYNAKDFKNLLEEEGFEEM